jgi:lysophospholipase L1-like esterase
MPATNSAAPFRLRPGTEGMMFESRIRINRLGFRGPEIPREKGNAYRIVTLGESTTFGHTMYEDDVPWPRVLERMITNNLRPQRPVQVINAGIPSYTLDLNLKRLHQRILALRPDMIISYHGYNGFNWLMPALPSVTDKAPPAYETRPLKLLGDAEYRLKVMAYRRERAAQRRSVAPVPLFDNEYARGYRELIELARTNNIRLVLANYSMAVNATSDLDVIAFYRSAFPEVFMQIQANELHSRIVETLAEQNTSVIFADTHPSLDGQYEKFIDLVHFTQPGRNDMAAAMFEAIKPVLQDQLGPPGG